MPARRKKLKRFIVKKKRPNLKMAVFWILLLLSLVILKLNWPGTRAWDGENKLNLAVQKSNGDVELVIFDPASEEITSILIPGNTEVDVSRNLGKWKLKSVWELGETNGGSGRLLTRTITKSFKFPVYLWGEDRMLGLKSGGFLDVLKACIYPYKTNLSFLDKAGIALFSMKVGNVGRSELDLSKSKLLDKVKLTDGSEGYMYHGDVLPEIYFSFNEPEFSGKSMRVILNDASGNPELIKNFGETVEIMGAKISQIYKETPKDVSCLVRSDNAIFKEKINKIFGCINDDTEGDTGVTSAVITLGSKFIETY